MQLTNVDPSIVHVQCRRMLHCPLDLLANRRQHQDENPNNKKIIFVKMFNS